MIFIETIIENLKINYVKKGTGRTVLILPGWGTTINVYKVLVDDISKYASVYCLDMPGCGGSEEPSNSWNVDDYISFVVN